MKSCKLSVLLITLLLSASLESFATGWPANYGGVMIQGFYWDSYDDTNWNTLKSQADELAGYFDVIWVPNSGQSSGAPNMGYLPIYWFTNHNSSFGNEASVRSMISTFKGKGLNVIMDVVINHRTGVSNWADFPAETWNGKTYKLDNSAVCCTDEWGRNGGNPTGGYDTGDDFDGGRDLDHTNATVQEHCKAYCKFLLDDMGYSGYRLDMVKGYSGYYNKIYNQYAKPRFCVGEYWDGYDNIVNWIESTGKESAAFDFPFKYALNSAMYFDYNDMSQLTWQSNGSPQPAGLVHQDYRQYAVTFIDNHDTYRNDNRFNGNVLAANAFMLCSPGTPCVFLPHWKDYKADIKKMIAIRKACGVTNTSAVNVLRCDNSCYMAVVYGNKGRLAVKIGPAMVSPDGFSDSQIKASGNNWCIWADVDVNVNTPPGPVDSGEYTIYWNNGSAKWSTPKVHYFGGVTSSAWPGVTMTLVSGTTNIYKCTVPSGTTGLVFNNGSGTQTDDLNALPSHIYNLSGDGGAYSGGNGGVDIDDEDTHASSDFVIYYDNSYSKWSTPTIYHWDVDKPEWAGVPMRKVSGQLWKYVVPAGTTGILFNAGDGDPTKTANMDAYATHVYNNSGNHTSIIPSELYVLGTVNGENWNPATNVKLTKSGHTFKGQITINGSGTSNTGVFSFAAAHSSSSSNWNPVNAANRYGAPDDDTPVSVGIPKVMTFYGNNASGDYYAGATKRWSAPAGTYQVIVDFDDFTVTLSEISISLNKSVIALSPGGTATLEATAEPAGLSGSVVTWASSDTGVATVSTSGTVTAVGKGSATITATYGIATATCTVYVGKTSQSILWTQDISNIAKGSTLNLTASATSMLPVTYTIIGGASFAHLTDDGRGLVADAPGIVTIRAEQGGNADYAPAETLTRTATITLGYTEGDTNGDGKINVTDITALIEYMFGNTPDGFNAEAADLDGDGFIGIVDITLLVKAIMSQPVNSINL